MTAGATARIRSEVAARRVTLAVLALCGLAIALVWLLQGRDAAMELVARQPAAGGWSRERIVVQQGDRVRLRIRSEDVVHGFAIGRLGVDAGPIEPGKVTTVEFVAGEPGEYTYYCTEWCDPNHPRMRGILEVRGPDGRAPAPAPDTALPHLDAPRAAPAVPGARPVASRGRERYEARCAACHGSRGQGTPDGPALGRDARADLSPVQVFQALRAGPAPPAGAPAAHVPARPGPADHRRYAPGWSGQETWDLVAHLWSLGRTPESVEAGRRLFARNCAACHGEGGAGDGPAGKHQPKSPADFTDARRMLAGTSALYLAKIRRGGMGTGMPYWGGIFTEEELRALVDRVWSFSLGIFE
ncbi:MAG: c-type cytochrome [Candidatus Methylomirabilales bacterium]